MECSNRLLRSISSVKIGSSMHDPKYGNCTFFPDIEGNGSIFALCKNIIFRFYHSKISKKIFFIFRSPDLSRSISDMTLTPFKIKIHPPPLLGSISRKRFATWKSGRFISARPLYHIERNFLSRALLLIKF